jgi:hypothetical protein
VVHFNNTNMAAMGIYEAEQRQHRVLNSWFDYGLGGELFVACFSVCPDKWRLSTLQQVAIGSLQTLPHLSSAIITWDGTYPLQLRNRSRINQKDSISTIERVMNFVQLWVFVRYATFMKDWRWGLYRVLWRIEGWGLYRVLMEKLGGKETTWDNQA